MTSLHTPPFASFHILRQVSEDPRPGTTTGKDRDCMDSASHGFSPHHFTLTLPVLSSVPFLSILFSSQASGFLCSFCDYRTFTRVSPRHTPHVTRLSMATLPEARCSLRLELENGCDTSPATLSLFLSLTLVDEALGPFSWVKVAIQQCKKVCTPSEHPVFKNKREACYFIILYITRFLVHIFRIVVQGFLGWIFSTR